MFDAIVPTYDVLNRLMSMGMDVGWRRRAVALCLRDRPSLALDVGTGTGDLVRMLAAGMAAGGRAVGVDFSLRMLRTARLTAARPVEAFVAADALELPFERGRMDAMVTAFTLRNVRDLKSALSSFARVLKSIFSDCGVACRDSSYWRVCGSISGARTITIGRFEICANRCAPRS